MNSRIEKIQSKWDEMSETWNRFRTDEIISSIVQDPYSVFCPQLRDILKRFIGGFTGKRVLVPASGDNRAVFAFHLLGAKVTSSDLSPLQLEHSAQVAAKHGWDIEFVPDDVMRLSQIKTGEYDLVYISNGVMFWLDDLTSMYTNIRRVLRPGGYHIMYDMHPFMYPFDTDNTTHLTLKKPYDSTGPFGDFSTYNWRLQDILNPMAAAGLALAHIEEMNAEYGTFWVDEDKTQDMPAEELARLYNSKTNPLYALPQAISIVGLAQR